MNTRKICFSRIIGAMLRNVSLLASALLLSPMVAYGAAVTLAWDANTEDDLAGYKIHYGTASHVYSHSIDVGNITEYTLTDLDEGVTYYLAATAYDRDNNQSAYSEELVHTFSVGEPTVGHNDYCRDAGPCAVGEGDCDNDSECEAGLTCVQVTGTDTCQTSAPDLNSNPSTPSVPVGPSTGYIQTSYNFGTAASDPDGDALEFRYDWGDAPISDWGASSQSHAWPSVGNFCVKAQAKDSYGALSGWSGCKSITITQAVTDSDEDGVPDHQDDFPNDADEDDLGSEPNYNESNFAPDPPQLLTPGNYEIVGLTPLLATDEFYDPNSNDVHSQTQWEIIRVHDGSPVFVVTTNSSLTALKVPKLILEADTDYSWQVIFIDNQGTPSEWSETGYFTTEFLQQDSQQDSDGNGVLDHQEVDTTIDLDKDGMMDRDQEDIKCVVTETGDFKIGISIREAENAESIMSIQSETPADTDLLLSAQDGPNFLAFGLIHFKLAVKEPGDEVLVTIYLSKAAYDDEIWYKYDPVNDEWVDYSEFIDFNVDRKTAYLTLTDGGFGDADGIANGIIVDPLALGTATDHSSGSDSFVEDLAGNLDPTGMCFISAAGSRPSDGQVPSFWSEIRSRELSIVFILMIFAYIGIEISLRINRNRKIGRRTSLMEGWRNSQG